MDTNTRVLTGLPEGITHSELLHVCMHGCLPALQPQGQNALEKKREVEGKECLKVAGVSDLSARLSAHPWAAEQL